MSRGVNSEDEFGESKTRFADPELVRGCSATVDRSILSQIAKRDSSARFFRSTIRFETTTECIDGRKNPKVKFLLSCDSRKNLR